MRRTLPRVSFHETCTLHDTTNRGPRKHATGMHCSIAVVPRVITHVKMKLQLSGTVYYFSTNKNNCIIAWIESWKSESFTGTYVRSYLYTCNLMSNDTFTAKIYYVLVLHMCILYNLRVIRNFCGIMDSWDCRNTVLNYTA